MAGRTTVAGAGLTAGAFLVVAPAAQATDYTVTTKADGAPPGPAGSLRKAISDANADPGADRILFDSSVTGSLLLSQSATLAITDELEIVGPGANELWIDAYYLPINAPSIFTADPAVQGTPVTISGLTIAYATTTGHGAAIFNQDAALTVEDSFLYANRTFAATPSPANVSGGALYDAADYANGTETTILDSTFLLNWAPGGSGGAIASADQLGQIRNSTIVGNAAGGDGPAATAGDGGGLFSVGGGSIQNSTIGRNSAKGDGGGIAASGTGGSAAALENSVVGDNAAEGFGDDIFGSDPFSANFSLISNTSNATVTSTEPGSNILGTSPGFVSYLELNESAPPTLSPAYDSPVIDQGKAAGGATEDQRGEPRPFDAPDIANSTEPGADASDMGAVELTLLETTPADMSIGLTDVPDPVFAGDPLTYTITVHNEGPEDATNVTAQAVFSEDLPFRVVDSSPDCSVDVAPGGQVVTCLFDSVLSGTTENRAFRMDVPTSGAGPYIYSYAIVFADQAEPYGYDNAAFEETVVHTRPTPVQPQTPAPFNLAAAVKRCKKKFPKGKRRARCIKKARAKAARAATARGGVVRHPWVARKRPEGAPRVPLRAYRRFTD
jgi:uncharacterized repeat protein (TIGR01451 family)